MGPQFRALLDDDSDVGMYCHDNELVDVCQKLATTNEAALFTKDNTAEDEEQPCDLEHSGMDAAQLLNEVWDEGKAAGEKLGDDSRCRAPHSQRRKLENAQHGHVGRLDEAP